MRAGVRAGAYSGRGRMSPGSNQEVRGPPRKRAAVSGARGSERRAGARSFRDLGTLCSLGRMSTMKRRRTGHGAGARMAPLAIAAGMTSCGLVLGLDDFKDAPRASAGEAEPAATATRAPAQEVASTASATVSAIRPGSAQMGSGFPSGLAVERRQSVQRADVSHAPRGSAGAQAASHGDAKGARGSRRRRARRPSRGAATACASRRAARAATRLARE
jgi:hypothetical protein